MSFKILHPLGHISSWTHAILTTHPLDHAPSYSQPLLANPYPHYRPVATPNHDHTLRGSYGSPPRNKYDF